MRTEADSSLLVSALTRALTPEGRGGFSPPSVTTSHHGSDVTIYPSPATHGAGILSTRYEILRPERGERRSAEMSLALGNVVGVFSERE